MNWFVKLAFLLFTNNGSTHHFPKEFLKKCLTRSPGSARKLEHEVADVLRF